MAQNAFEKVKISDDMRAVGADETLFIGKEYYHIQADLDTHATPVNLRGRLEGETVEEYLDYRAWVNNKKNAKHLLTLDPATNEG